MARRIVLLCTPPNLAASDTEIHRGTFTSRGGNSKSLLADFFRERLAGGLRKFV